MGGCGSGRYGGWPTSEATDSLVIDIAALRRGGLRAGFVASSHYTWTSSFDGEFSADMLIDTRGRDDASIVLRHITRDNDPREIAYRVPLTATRPPFGGLRWWFICPARGDLRTKLFLPLGGSRFLSREAYRLGYACQRGTKLDRLHRKARKLKLALGGDGEFASPTPPKPRGMHRSTYAQKVAQLNAVEAAIAVTWIDSMPKRLLGVIGKLI
ncbi:MAG: hypothetical protein V3T13_07300 [Hyphomicrobium sp.]